MKCETRRSFLFKGTIALTGTAANSEIFAQLSPLSFAAPKPSPSTAANPAEGSARLCGLMVDAARVPESIEYYKRVIEFCTDWGLNALQFRVADDQGCAVRFSSVPDLLFHKNAFTLEQMKELAQFARQHGVDLIPELESFGHTGYITRSPAFAHLLDNDPQGSTEFTGVIPVHAETLELFKKLYGEIATIFPSNYLHGGCDEVNWGGSPLSREALRTKSRDQIWAEYLNSLNQVAGGLSKQFIVWGDFVLHKEPTILSRLAKNVIIMDWNYKETSAVKIHEALSMIRANGSRGIGAPGLISYRWGSRAGAEQLGNINAFADSYLATQDPGSMGAILTNWVPSRYIQNSIWDGFAYAAVAFKEGSAAARNSGFRRFVERHYRADWNDTWDEAFRLIYAAAPQVEEEDTSHGIPLHVPWNNDEQLAAVLKNRSPRSVPFTQIRSLLVQLEAQVLKNLSDFQAFALSVRYLEQLFLREAIVIEYAAKKSLAKEDAGLIIQSIAERDRTLAEVLSKDWDQGRFSDSAAKLKPLFGFEPKDQLLFQWQQAASYSASLASRPDRFHQLLTESNPA